MKGFCQKTLCLSVGAFIASSASALTLDGFLQRVQEKHLSVKSLNAQKEASDSRLVAGDVGLAPILSLKASILDDKNIQSLGGYLTDHTKATEYSLGLAKKFSTGTNAQVLASVTETQLVGTNLTATPPQGFDQTFARGSLGISVSQSLWKDGFGAATSLRREREALVSQAEKQSYDLQLKQLMIDAESAYWDYLYQQEELSQRKDSLQRAKRIESWMQKRVGNGIGDDSDLLNAQGLVAGRELQLLASQDESLAVEKKMRDLLELAGDETLPDVTGDLRSNRKLEQMISSHQGGRRVRLDTYLSILEAKAKATAANEIADAYRPDLVLEGQYKTNSNENRMTDAANKISDSSRPTEAVALKLVWLLDSDLKNAAKQTAKSEALAANYKKDRKLLEGESAWQEMNRRHSELSKKILAADLAANIQTKKAAAQRDKLSKGRAITTDVVTAEQDAAESLLLVTKLRAEQRKLEAQGRLFVTIEE